SLLRGRLADVDGARRVRAVPVLGAAEVEHDHVALLDDAIALLVVRVRAVRARGDDRELDRGVAVRLQELGQLSGDLRLGPAGEARRRGVLEDGVRGRAGGGETRELL